MENVNSCIVVADTLLPKVEIQIHELITVKSSSLLFVLKTLMQIVIIVFEKTVGWVRLSITTHHNNIHMIINSQQVHA